MPRKYWPTCSAKDPANGCMYCQELRDRRRLGIPLDFLNMISVKEMSPGQIDKELEKYVKRWKH